MKDHKIVNMNQPIGSTINFEIKEDWEKENEVTPEYKKDMQDAYEKGKRDSFDDYIMNTKTKNEWEEIKWKEYNPPMHLPSRRKFGVYSVDEEGREYEGFCPRCLMTEVEASKNDCYYPEWTKSLLSSERKRLREEIEKMKIHWNKSEREKFSTNEIDAISYEISYNQVLKDILKLL